MSIKRKRALIVVDLANDFMPGGALAVEKADEVIAPINRLAAEGGYDFVVAIQDWHTPEHSSFRTWPPHCIAGTPGAEFHKGFEMKNLHALIRKGFHHDTDSYSGFYDEDGQSNGLAELLRARKITDVDVAGIATDYCVKATTIEAAEIAGFKTRVLLYACRGVGLEPGDVEKAIAKMEAAGVEIVKEEETAAAAGELSLDTA